VDHTISELILSAEGGDRSAADALFAALYDELHRLARRQLARKAPDLALGTTTLLHEAYLRLLRTGPGTVDSRDAFFRLMAAEMRRRLIDHARRRLAEKRGGRVPHEPLGSSVAAAVFDPEDDDELPARLDRALAELDKLFPRAARVVQLKFFVGLTTEEAAGELGLSAGTVKRDWTFARAWLAAAIEGEGSTTS